MRYIFVLAVLLLVQPAQAQEALYCSMGDNYSLCEWGTRLPPDAKIIHVRPDNSQAALERARKWEQHCQPTPWVDSFGVTRMRYAKVGCEFGVSE